MRVDRASTTERDGVRGDDAAPDVELTARARQRRGGHRRHVTVQLLGDGPPGHVRVRRPHVAAEGDGQRDGEDDLDLLLVAAIRVVDGLAQAAGERVGAGVTA